MDSNNIPLPQDIGISVFESAYSQCAHDYTLQRFINLIRTKTRYTPVIEFMRRLDKSDPAYKAAKLKMCAFSISCQIPQGEGRKSAPARNNGVVCVDIDASDNPHLTDWGLVRYAVGALNYTYLSALSAGGKGVFAVVAVDPDTPHEKTFDALKLFFADRLGVNIDSSCRDIARLRTISYDPQAICRQPTAVFKVYKGVEQAQAHPQRRRAAIAVEGDGYDRIRAAVRLWVRKGIALNNYDDWTRAAAALKGVPGGEQMFDDVSQFGKSYKGATESARKMRQVAGMGRVSEATFIYLCNQYGISNAEITEEARAMGQRRPAPDSIKGSATASPTPIAPETQGQAQERNASMLEQAAFAVDLLRGVYDLRPPTPAQVRILDPAAPSEPPPF